jgi:hypothetical protein
VQTLLLPLPVHEQFGVLPQLQFPPVQSVFCDVVVVGWLS